MFDTACLYSTVKNVSGGPKVFGFLPPHGRELAAGEEYTVFGHITEAIIKHDRGESMRAMHAFEKAVSTHKLAVVSTPAPILEDTSVAGSSKMIKMTGGALGTANPCWMTSVSEPSEFQG